MGDTIATAQADTNAVVPVEQLVKESDTLQDAAFTALEAYQAKPDDEALKTASKQAAEKAKAAVTAARKAQGEAKTKADADAKTRAVPEKYDLKVPEGSSLDAPAVEKIAAYAKAQGFSQAQAQALVDRDAQAVASFQEGQTALLKTKQTEWKTTSAADPEFGGDKFPKSAEIAKRVVARYGSAELKTALEDSGLGDHPELVRMLVRIGSAMTEDQLISGSTGTQQKSRAPEDILYGEKPKE